MSCEYISLYRGSDGYIVRCKHCGSYQLAFAGIMLLLEEYDFQAFCRVVSCRCSGCHKPELTNQKNIVIETPAQGIWFLLTPAETQRLQQMLVTAGGRADKSINLSD